MRRYGPPKARVYADLYLVIHFGDQRRSINSSCEFPFFEQLLVNRDVGVVGIHVLHAGYSDRGSMCETTLDGVPPLDRGLGGGMALNNMSRRHLSTHPWDFPGDHEQSHRREDREFSR